MYEYYQSLDEDRYVMVFAETQIVGQIRLSVAPNPESAMFIVKYIAPNGGLEITHRANLGEAFQWIKDRHEDDIMNEGFGC